MCGIVGYVGGREAASILLNGLRRLEYRGYDSAGVATLDTGKIVLRRAVGRVEALEARVAAEPSRGTIGIAHTRWATHGGPSERNAHPHLDAAGRVAVVHNGIIENHGALRAYLEGQGVIFRSETDTEALAQLIGFLLADGIPFAEAVRQALLEVRGTFGVAVLCTEDPGRLIVARRGSPLLLGIGDGEVLVASDGSALVEQTRRVVYLSDNEMAVLAVDGWNVSTLAAQPVKKAVQHLELALEQIELGPYQHHMAKEIHEQPTALRNAMAGRLQAEEGRVTLAGLATLGDVGRIRRVVLTGCGTAWHACLIGEYLLEELARLPAEVEYASELRYRNPVVEEGTLAIVVSQSGETADTLAAMHELKLKGARAFGVVNVVGSTIARETDGGVFLHAGPEVGVASTKAFTAQVAVLAMVAMDLGRRRHLSPERAREFMEALRQIPDKVEAALGVEPQVRALAERLAPRPNWLYLGRGVNYPVALEGALKLKEISYIHAEGLPAAEIKHGPIALVEPGMPVVVVAPRDHTYEKVLSNIQEVKGRGGTVVAIATEGDEEVGRLADEVIHVPPVAPLLSPLVTTIPLQLLAYHAALQRGMNVDRPRNLAKSVTVE